ncbi:MAG: hypothetical protein IKW88_01000 [Clostridiales bacterium]|nr:hypothetical protein [Clostridiales bacterium]
MSETRPADQDRDQQQLDREQLPVTQRVNPRLVFSDPDAFFLDLLLEQNEQG